MSGGETSTIGRAQTRAPDWTPTQAGCAARLISRLQAGSDEPLKRAVYGAITPIVRTHLSTSSGHLVIGKFVRRIPKPCLPSAYKCISAGTPAFFNAM